MLRRTISAVAAVVPISLVFTEGSASSWGWNQYGQLGVGTEKDEASPTPIEFLRGKGVVALKSSGPSNSTAAVTASGSLYTFGCGKDARLGHGDSVDVPNQTIPRLVATLTGHSVKDVAVGEYHMVVVVDDGSLWSFGKNRVGQLGHSNARPGFPSPVDGLDGVKVVDVACGRQHSVALSSDGEVYTWGFGKDGALGHGSRDSVGTPKKVEGLAGKHVTEVACGREFTLALTSTGEVFAWGRDDVGQLGQGMGSTRRSPVQVASLGASPIVHIVAGENHSLAINADGQVYSWGLGSHGQLGHGDRNDIGIPRLIDSLEGVKVIGGAGGGAHTLLRTAEGKVFAFGRGRNGQLGRDNHLESIAAYRTTPVEIDALASSNVVALSAGDSHSLALIDEK